MSFKLDTKKFKKIGGDAQKTVMKHEDGHELTIAHKGLSPKMRAALVEMPMATKAGEDHKASSQKTSANKGEIKMADGGRVSNADQRQSIVDAYNGKKGQPQGQAGNGQVWGGGDYLQVAPQPQVHYTASEPRQIPYNNMPVATPERPMGEDVGYNKAELAAMSPDQRAIAIQSMQQQQMAQAAQAAMVRNPAGAQAAADAQAGYTGTLAQQQAAMLANPPAPQANPQMPAYAKGGKVEKPQHFDEGGMPDFNQNATPAAPPQESMPAPAPQEDPSLAAKRSVYNQIVNGDAGPIPSAPNGNPDGSFGPNGEAPKNFNADAWKAAEAKFQADQARTVNTQQQASAQVVEDNKARMAAGLPPMPVPAAPALPQNPMQVPAGSAPQPQQGGMAAQAPSQPGDPFGTNTYEQNYMKGINEQKAGIAGQARAEAAQGNAEAAMLQNNVILQQQNQKTYQDHYNELDKERQAFQQDIANSHIDPKHFLNSLGTGGRIVTAIGLIIGGMGGGGNDNAAFNYLKDNINRDIDAQKVELGKKENLLSANLKQFNNLRDATDMTRVMQNDIVSNQLKQAAAKAQDPLSKARALQAAGKLDTESAPILSQIAMKKSLLGGMQAGQISPERVVQFFIPEGPTRQAATKELEQATTLSKARDNLLSAFDQSAPLVTAGHRMGNPIQAQRQVDAIQGPVIEQLAKDNEGRVTPTTVQYLKGLMPSMGDNAETAALKRAKLNDFASAKMQSTQFPTLKAYGIDMSKQGRFSPQGASRIPESAPVLKRK